MREELYGEALRHLAAILAKAQGVMNAETKEAIHVGDEVVRLRRIFEQMQAATALQAERVMELEEKQIAIAMPEGWTFRKVVINDPVGEGFVIRHEHDGIGRSTAIFPDGGVEHELLFAFLKALSATAREG
jgi:hypothetical protein